MAYAENKANATGAGNTAFSVSTGTKSAGPISLLLATLEQRPVLVCQQLRQKETLQARLLLNYNFIRKY
jgi:hypothetical protein